MTHFARRGRILIGFVATAIAISLIGNARDLFADSQLAASAAANQIAEITFTAANAHADPFNDVTLDAVFTDPAGASLRVPAFWDGEKTWKVRFASGIVGEHHFKTECSDASDKGLNGVEGVVRVTTYDGDNPLYKRGPLKIAADHRHFQQADGTPFLWLGDTWWMGLSTRLQWPEEFAALTADRTAKGFNVVQIVAGLYPDQPAFDPRSANEAGFAWEEKYRSIRPQYFDMSDRRIFYLVDHGIVPCIVGGWGYHLPWMGVEKMKQHLRYVAARWGALPVVFCGAGEFNLPFYLAPGFPGGGEKQAAQWSEIFKYFHTVNAFSRPFTAHPTGIAPLSARLLLKDQSIFDFDMLQTGHGMREVLAPTVSTVRASLAADPPMPVVEGEVTYEALSGSTPAEIPRLMCWACYMSGTAGFTYGANGIWQLNRKGAPYGNSPFGGNYGPIPWDEAMILPGSKQVGLAAKLLRTLPFDKFTPHPEWAGYATGGQQAALDHSNWIWFPEGEPAVDAPIAARFFRRTFQIPDANSVEHASLVITADDRYTAWINGKELGSGADWRDHHEFGKLETILHPGKNVLTVRAENMRSNVEKNPAGLVGQLHVQFQDRTTLNIVSDASWCSAQAAADGWQAADFDDAQWPAAKVIAPFGSGPWGGPGASPVQDFEVPYSAGIPNLVRVVYVPKPMPILIHGLESGAQYTASEFDPVTGEIHTLGAVDPNAAGDWQVTDPKTNHDWGLVLETAEAPKKTTR